MDDVPMNGVAEGNAQHRDKGLASPSRDIDETTSDAWRKPLSHRCGGAINGPAARTECDWKCAEEGVACRGYCQGLPPLEEVEDQRPGSVEPRWLKDDIGRGPEATRYWG